MALAPGAKLGPYEIVSLLGAGGMGEVYRALDTRLGRSVAIKVLPEGVSETFGVPQQLEHEARAISKLAHPNICTLHDISHRDGRAFLVLEFVEGKTLRHLLANNLLPMRKVIPIAVQIADGLAKAHEMGIIHSDLKPENVMISGEMVKILDFGLAKLTSGGSGQSEHTTVAVDTHPEMILGTVGYMSPEQASARELDFRSDQFSLGLVLYEMVTGKRPFQRKTQAQTLLAIVRDEPEPISALNPEVPPPFCWVIERCLSKDPEKRYFSTRDLARDLLAIRDRLSDLQVKRPAMRPSHLPVPATAFVGRTRELVAVGELLQRPEVRLVTITGPGGIGKSRLALELGRSVSEDFPSGVYFVPLGAISEASAIPLAITQALGIRESSGQSALENLKDYLQNSLRTQLLLLIDNFEHLVEGAPVLGELLALTNHLKILVTSRQALRVYHEQEFPLPPLAVPDTKSLTPLQALAEFPAISLFVQRAAAVKPDFKLTEENQTAVTEICARLDGLPLAIELAAARVKVLSPSAMRARLESRLQLLVGGARDLPARQQTLRHAIDWSYDLLSGPEQRLLRRLSVFRGGCTLDAAESVCNTKGDLGMDVLEGMASMVDKSLVWQIERDEEPRFATLETIREYGLEKLTASGEEDPVRRAHAAYCLVLAEEGAAAPSGEANQWHDRFEIEHDNFRTAIDWLVETGNAEWGLRLGLGLFRFWEMREHLAEGRERLGKLLKLPAAAGSNDARMRALFAAGVLATEQGDYAVSNQLFEESLDIARRLQNERSIAVALNAIAVNARDCGDLPAARSLFEESLVAWRKLEDTLAVARGLSNLGSILNLQEDYAQSRAVYEESLSILRMLADKRGIAWALNHQGDVARNQRDFLGAQTLYEESLETFRELDDHWGIAACLADMGNLACDQKNYRTADSLYRESIRMFQQLEHKRGIARLLESFACSAAAQEESERSLRLAGAAAAVRQGIGAPLTPAEQCKLERNLDEARGKLSSSAGRTAWLEGWVMPIEKAIEDVLKVAPEPSPRIGRPTKGAWRSE